MSFQHNPAPGVTGLCVVGTISGDTLITEAYFAPPGAPVEPVMLAALEALWSKLPAALNDNGPGRFDFLIRHQLDGAESPADVLWHSGMSASTLFSVVARRLLKVRAAARSVHPGSHVQAQGVEVTEVADDGAIEWVPPVERVLNTLAAVRQDPWASVRA